MIYEKITISYKNNGIDTQFSIDVIDNPNLAWDIAKTMYRVIDDSGAGLEGIIDLLKSYLPGDDYNALLKKGE